MAFFGIYAIIRFTSGNANVKHVSLNETAAIGRKNGVLCMVIGPECQMPIYRTIAANVSERSRDNWHIHTQTRTHSIVSVYWGQTMLLLLLH